MPSLTDQIKTPYVEILDASGQQIATSIKGSGTVVVRFNYRFDDEDDDRCVIKIQTNDPKAFDRLNIGRGFMIQYRYGYIGGPHSAPGYVVIRDIQSHYGTSEITTELECTDLLTYLKIARADDTEELSLIDYIKKQCNDKYNIEIRQGNNTLFRMVRGSKVRSTTLEYSVKINDNEVLNFDPTDDSPEGFRKVKMPNPTEGLEVGKWFNTGEVRDFLEKPQSIVSSSRSQFVVIQDILRACPKGPWYVTGRGDTLLIHNRDLGRTPYKVYIYMKGDEKVDIVAKTKYESFETESLSYSGMDPSERSNYYIDDYRKQLYNTRSFKEIVNDKTLSEEDFKKEVSNYFNIRYNLYSKWRVTKTDGSFVNIHTDRDLMITEKEPYKNLERIKQAIAPVPVKDQTLVSRPDPMLRILGKEDDDLKYGILKFKWLTVPLNSKEDIVNYTDNNQRAMEMDKEEATITVEGDPFIQSQMVVGVINIHRQHEGNYYIKKCDHTLDAGMGYETKMECLKVVPEAINTKLVEKEKTEFKEGDEDTKIEKQWMTEQRLFQDVIRVGNDARLMTGYGAPGAGGLGQHYDYIDYKDLDELWASGYTDDQLMEIAQSIRNGKTHLDYKEANVEHL